MRSQIGSCTLELVRGDITNQDTDAIVNAANSRLAGGRGVDGAIHRNGGPTIMEELQEKYPQGCSTGNAVITGAGNLPAKYVVHAVGPVWSGGQHSEKEKRISTYRYSLDVSVENQCRSISFPSLSTGAYHYPVSLAAWTALGTVIEYLKKTSSLELVRFVLFNDKTYEAYISALEDALCGTKEKADQDASR